jgi:acetyl-CoA carboxylase biotin carboxyl carrier protein
MKRNTPKRPGDSPETASVDFKELERVLDFMAEHNLEEVEYRRGELHVRLRKPSSGFSVISGNAAGQGAPAAAPPGASGGATQVEAQAGATSAAAAEALQVLKSPIVGTFYAAPTPQSEPFVKVGDKVKAGQVVCIIEAMKLMNEIEAERAGEIVHRLVENGQPVEYGQGLFALRPAPGE